MKREVEHADVARFVAFATLIAVLLSAGVPVWAALLTVLGSAFLMACGRAWRDFRREQDDKPFGPEIERIP